MPQLWHDECDSSCHQEAAPLVAVKVEHVADGSIGDGRTKDRDVVASDVAARLLA